VPAVSEPQHAEAHDATASGSVQGTLELPPLAGLCALAALASMAVNQITLPLLGSQADQLLALRLGRAGQFAENLAVIAGTIALVATTIAMLRGEGKLSIRRRVLGVVLVATLLRAVVVATLLERTSTTRENVYLAVGAANALCVLCGMVAVDAARTLLGRVVAMLATCVPMFGLLSTTLALTSDVSFDAWKRRAHDTLETFGELSYLALLLLAAFAVMPRFRTGRRELLARAGGFAVVGAALSLMHVARAALKAEYGVLLYHAQRVELFLDGASYVYALPFAAALGAALAAMLAGAARVQAGAALLLILVSSSAPQAPGRLLTMTLGFVLLARAQQAFAQRV
jgi:hypothetical protein